MKKVLGAICAVFCIAGGLFLAAAPKDAQAWEDDIDVYDGTKLTGRWNMTTTVELTTCTDIYVGEKSSKEWALSFSAGEVQIKSSSGATLVGDAPYRRDASEKYTMGVRPTKNSSVAAYDFKMTKAGKAFAGRLIAQGKDCVYLSSATLTKL